MSTVTKPIVLDETVQALNHLIGVIPEALAVASALAVATAAMRPHEMGRRLPGLIR